MCRDGIKPLSSLTRKQIHDQETVQKAAAEELEPASLGEPGLPHADDTPEIWL